MTTEGGGMTAHQSEERGKRRGGIDWESQAALDDDPAQVAPPDHNWLAHEAGYIDDEVDAIEAELLAWSEDISGSPQEASDGR